MLFEYNGISIPRQLINRKLPGKVLIPSSGYISKNCTVTPYNTVIIHVLPVPASPASDNINRLSVEDGLFGRQAPNASITLCLTFRVPFSVLGLVML
jgi:hypothetical protein